MIVAFFVLICALDVVAADDVRVERGYRNGKPVRIKVVTIGWADVEVATARAFEKMQAAAERAGLELSIRSGFRSYERQQWLYRAWKEGWGNKAARPGFSNHQSGRALDLRVDAEILAWLGKHARRYGFRQTVRGEPWHWEFTPPRRATARASSRRRRS